MKHCRTTSTLESDQIKTQKLFESCSEYLDQRHHQQSVHSEIRNLEQFLSQSRPYPEKPEPIIVGSQHGPSEDMHAIYKLRQRMHNSLVDERSDA